MPATTFVLHGRIGSEADCGVPAVPDIFDPEGVGGAGDLDLLRNAADLGDIRLHDVERAPFEPGQEILPPRGQSSPSTSAIGDSAPFLRRLMNAFGTPNLVWSLDMCGWGRGYATRYAFRRRERRHRQRRRGDGGHREQRLPDPLGLQLLLHARSRRLTINATGKQPALFRRNAGVTPGRPDLPPLPQQVEDLGRKHHMSVLAAFRLHDADDHLLTVDVARSQGAIGLQAAGSGSSRTPLIHPAPFRRRAEPDASGRSRSRSSRHWAKRSSGGAVESARKINVIVVYKVDRLTRSLADFAKLVEPFDIIEGAQLPLRPLHLVVRETEFCGQRLAGDFSRRMRENGRNSVRRPRHASLTDRNCEGFCRPGNRVEFKLLVIVT